ncbi:MAG: histidinol dehydrogenase [cyanobacterium endosymbiont of Epithemia adnata isolate EadnSB Bon19]
MAKTAAIVMLSYGTKTFPRVEVITGIGNLEVTLAKKQFMER